MGNPKGAMSLWRVFSGGNSPLRLRTGSPRKIPGAPGSECLRQLRAPPLRIPPEDFALWTPINISITLYAYYSLYALSAAAMLCVRII